MHRVWPANFYKFSPHLSTLFSIGTGQEGEANMDHGTGWRPTCKSQQWISKVKVGKKSTLRAHGCLVGDARRGSPRRQRRRWCGGSAVLGQPCRAHHSRDRGSCQAAAHDICVPETSLHISAPPGRSRSPSPRLGVRLALPPLRWRCAIVQCRASRT